MNKLVKDEKATCLLTNEEQWHATHVIPIENPKHSNETKGSKQQRDLMKNVLLCKDKEETNEVTNSGGINSQLGKNSEEEIIVQHADMVEPKQPNDSESQTITSSVCRIMMKKIENTKMKRTHNMISIWWYINYLTKYQISLNSWICKSTQQLEKAHRQGMLPISPSSLHIIS